MESSARVVRGIDYPRPRRPNPGTVAYLRSLPLDVEVAVEEISNFVESSSNGPTEYPQSLAAALSALDEIQKEVASLAGDELAAEMIEILVRVTAPYSEWAARKWLLSCQGYALHLATHRYGSHVLQTILQLSVVVQSDSDLARHEDAPTLEQQQDLPSLVDLLLGFQEELAPHAWDLAMHVCGSHVLRTLLCVLGGVELLQTRSRGASPLRRGKAKSKKKPIDNEIVSSHMESRMVFLSNPRIDVMDPSIVKALQQLTTPLTGDQVKPPGDLQSLACHSSGGPLLGVLLRVLTYRPVRDEWAYKLQKRDVEVAQGADHHLGMIRPEPQFALDSDACGVAKRLLCWQDDNKEWAPDVIFGLAGESRGSHCLETILQLSPDDLYQSILEIGDLQSKETIDDYLKHNVSKYVAQTLLTTARTREQVRNIILGLEPMVTSGFILDPDKKRRNILWRMVEAASLFKVCQERLLESISTGFAALTGQEKPMNAQSWVPLLLNLKKPDHDGERLSLDVAGTRTVHYLLRFEPKLCKSTLSGILDISNNDLELLARDGLGSRCILDGMLRGPTEEPIFANAVSKLASKLASRWVALSGDRIAHHVVNKLFRNLSNDKAREELVKELVSGKKRLGGSSMGRSVLATCLVHEYETKGTKEWAKMVKKRVDKEEWLDDIVHGVAVVVDDDDDNNKGGKRKRDDHQVSGNNKKWPGQDTNVQAIMDTIKIPEK